MQKAKQKADVLKSSFSKEAVHKTVETSKNIQSLRKDEIFEFVHLISILSIPHFTRLTYDIILIKCNFGTFDLWFLHIKLIMSYPVSVKLEISP